MQTTMGEAAILESARVVVDDKRRTIMFMQEQPSFSSFMHVGTSD